MLNTDHLERFWGAPFSSESLSSFCFSVKLQTILPLPLLAHLHWGAAAQCALPLPAQQVQHYLEQKCSSQM